MYDDSPGSMGERRTNRATGQPYPRIGRTPCLYCPKQPHTVPEAERCPATAAELSDQNWLAYQHYLMCRATNRFPDDWIVGRNAATIRQAEDSVAQLRTVQLATLGMIKRGM